MGAPQVAAGWHDDPNGSGQLRWWDGAQWTEHLAPRPDAAPAAQAAAPALAVAAPVHVQVAAAPAAPPQVLTPSLPAGDAPSVQKAFVMGILAVVFNVLFIPSILAIRWSRQARDEIAMSGGRLGGASKVKAARVMGWLGVAFGTIGGLVAVLMVVAGAAVVSEVGTDVAYQQQVNGVGNRTQAALQPLQAAHPTPAQIQTAISGMEAEGVKLHAITPPTKVATEHAQLLAGFDQALAGLKELQAANASSTPASINASLAKLTKGADAVQAASIAINRKLLA